MVFGTVDFDENVRICADSALFRAVLSGFRQAKVRGFARDIGGLFSVVRQELTNPDFWLRMSYWLGRILDAKRRLGARWGAGAVRSGKHKNCDCGGAEFVR